MKILGIDLDRFGPFTDRKLSFGDRNLHVIVGDNGVGKSTILRAIRALLFGIPERTKDDHVHRMPDLRIGAHLENEAGDQIEVVRLKRRKDSLLSAAGDALEERALAPFLGGADVSVFDGAFGLGHEVLVRGGKELLANRGDVAGSLFGAALGLPGLRELRERIGSEADAIFKPKGRKLPLNDAVTAAREAKQRRKSTTLERQAWSERRAKLDTLRESARDLSARRASALEARERLQRFERALPAVVRRNKAAESLHGVADAPLLPDDAAETRHGAEATIQQVERQLRSHAERETELRRELEALEVPEAVLSLRQSIAAERDELGAHRKAEAHLLKLEERIRAADAEIATLVEDLGREPSSTSLDDLRVPSTTRTRVRALGKEHADLVARIAGAEGELRRVESDYAGSRDRLDHAAPDADVAPLRSALRAARKQGDLDERVRDLDREITKLDRELDRRLSALGLWPGTLDEIGAAPFPSSESIERFRKEFDAVEARRERAKGAVADAAKSIGTLDREIAELRAGRRIPSEEGVVRLRGLRDLGWAKIRAAFLGEPLDVDPPAASERAESARAYEDTVRTADREADELFRDTERVVAHDAKVAERRRAGEQQASAESALAAVESDAARLLVEWKALWVPSGVEPLGPAEMGAWLRRTEELAESARRRENLEVDRRARVEDVERTSAGVRKALVTLSEQPRPELDLAALLELGDERLGAFEAKARERVSLETEIERLNQERTVRTTDLESNERALEAWRAKWAAAVEAPPLALPADASPDVAERVLETLTTIASSLAERADSTRRVDGIRADAERFSRAVRELVGACAPDLAGVPVEQAIVTLADRADAARKAEERRTQLEAELERIEGERTDLTRERDESETTLVDLTRRAGVPDRDALPEAEHRSRRRRELERTIAETEDHLAGEGVPVEELVAAVTGLDPDQLAAELQAARERLAEVETERDATRDELKRLEIESEQTEGLSAAAEAAAEQEEHLARAETLADRYVVLAAARWVLDREIRAYGERNREPVLERATEIFRHVTLGEYVDLVIDRETSDEGVIVCLRSDAKRVAVEGLSEGTRDQLYFALRLATLENTLSSVEPLPLVIDDAFVNFDDHRAKAAFEVLEQVASKIQVLFFTHHPHVAAIAEQAVAPASLAVHRLDREPRSEPGSEIAA